MATLPPALALDASPTAMASAAEALAPFAAAAADGDGVVGRGPGRRYGKGTAADGGRALPRRLRIGAGRGRVEPAGIA